MLFEQIKIGGNRNFAYLIGDATAGVAAAVDVGYNPQMILDRCAALDVKLQYLFATHSHPDHIGAIPELREMTGATYAAYKTVDGVDMPLDDGDEVAVGDVRVKVIFCPGHRHDSIGLLVNDKKLISGDELFVGKIGGTGTEAMARQQHENLHARFMTLDDDVEVWPGHDFGVKPHSTIGEERASNPFLLQQSFEDFWHLKNNWAEYKREHGIA